VGKDQPELPNTHIIRVPQNRAHAESAAVPFLCRTAKDHEKKGLRNVQFHMRRDELMCDIGVPTGAPKFCSELTFPTRMPMHSMKVINPP